MRELPPLYTLWEDMADMATLIFTSVSANHYGTDDENEEEGYQEQEEDKDEEDKACNDYDLIIVGIV